MGDILNNLIESLFKGESPNSWLFMKFITAFLGGLSAFFFKQYNIPVGETKIKFFWQGFLFTVISMFGGVFIIGPSNAFNAFVSGVLGWSAIANTIKQDNKGATKESYVPSTLTIEQIQDLLKNANK